MLKITLLVPSPNMSAAAKVSFMSSGLFQSANLTAVSHMLNGVLLWALRLP